MSPAHPKPPKRLVKARTPVKKRRSTPRRQLGKCPELVAWVHTQPCWIVGMVGGRRWLGGAWWESLTVETAHLPRTRRLGGDLFNVIPLEKSHHAHQHQVGVKSWLAAHGRTMDELTAAARDYTLRFAQETGYILPGEGL